WGFLLGLVVTGAVYLAFDFVFGVGVHGGFTLVLMTMYLVLFKQGQAAVSSSLSAISAHNEDGLYQADQYIYIVKPVAT
ncbi:ABC transporter ATP-binding protein, partial [Pseudomonas syringae pv. tagetis]